MTSDQCQMGFLPRHAENSASFYEMARDPSQIGAGNPQGFKLSNAQWNFIYYHYPDYASSPYDLMTLLQMCAVKAEVGGSRISTETDHSSTRLV